MEAQKEFSEDSYCTTDEGEEQDEKQYESDKETVNDDYVGKIHKIKEDNIIKEIFEVGEGKDKPVEIDTVVISVICYIEVSDYGIIEIPEINLIEKEISLDSNNLDVDESDQTDINLLPKALSVSIQSMRKGEKCKIMVKPSYIFKHFDKLGKGKYSELMYDNEFRLKCINMKSKFTFEVKLHNFYMCQNLMDRGEIRKKILINGTSWKYARNPDVAYYDLSCYYNNKEIYSKTNMISELDKMSLGNLFEIEKRIIQNIKVGEMSEIIVKPSYMNDKNPQFLKFYNLDNIKNTIFKCSLHKIDVYDYVYKPDKDIFTKKRILNKGFGRGSPDRESIVKVKLQVKIDGKIIFNNFENENIDQYINSFDHSIYPNWRTEINSKFNISEVDDDENFERDSKIFNLFDTEFNTTKGIEDIDLRFYSVPLVLRKVLIHMKRNELCFVRMNYIDYLKIGTVQLENISENKIEIYIQLYEFLHRDLFSKHSYEDKLKELTVMKDLANSIFKEGKMFRAGKIYQNINYRFNYGDVFTNNGIDLSPSDNAEENLNRISPLLYQKLTEIRLNCHNNLANSKFKLGKYISVYQITHKILKEFDKNNLKALYLLGKSCIQLKKYEEAIESFKKINTLMPNNEDFKDSLKEAENLHKNELQKQKNIFKKMIFSNGDN